MTMTPPMTNAVPISCKKDIDSFRISMANAIVDTGPIPPMIDPFGAPMRLMPSANKKEGIMVATIAMIKQ